MSRVAIVGGVRTPFVRAGGVFAKRSFLDLGIHVTRALVKKLALPHDGASIDEFIFGTVLLDPRTPNCAREIVIRSGLSPSLRAHAVSNNCITGLVAASMIADGIRAGRIKTGLAGGSESMSRPTLTLKPAAEQWFLSLARARSMGERLKTASAFRPKLLFPQPPSPKEPSTGLTMGEHCELSAKEFSIGREAQDLLALKSHQGAAAAAAAGNFRGDIEPLDGIDADNLVRADTSKEKLAKLSPVFDRSPSGTLTAGNSSSLTDGASVVCLMSDEEARAQGREILGYIEGIEFAALHPKDGLLMAPGIAVPRLLHKLNLSVSDIDRFEIHEAFAAQVLANRVIWKNGWTKFPEIKPIGEIPEEKINVWGGSIALGHPFAATGGRLLMNAVRILNAQNLNRCLISVCAAGGMAAAVLVSRR